MYPFAIVLLITSSAIILSCTKKDKVIADFKCVEYKEGVKPFCADPEILSTDDRIKEIQLRICADPEKRKMQVCVRMEKI